MTDHPPHDGREPSPAIESADVTYTLDEDEHPSGAVVRAVASLTNTAVLDLNPLYDVIDPDHLNSLFADIPDDGSTEQSTVTFNFNGCTVTVTRNVVHVREDDGDAS